MEYWYKLFWIYVYVYNIEQKLFEKLILFLQWQI